MTDLRLITEKKANFSATLQEFSAKNLALAFFGADNAVIGGTIVGEALPLGLAVGDYARVANMMISTVSITDSTATPIALVEGTDYTITSPDHGTLNILNIGAFVQPFLVSYTYGNYNNVPMFSLAQQEYWVRFDGLNTAYSNSPVEIELYRVVFDPLDTMDLVSDAVLDMKLSGSVLDDPTKTGDASLGTFGRIMTVA